MKTVISKIEGLKYLNTRIIEDKTALKRDIRQLSKMLLDQ